MADEPIRVSPREHHRIDRGIGVRAVHQLIELFREHISEEPERTSVDSNDENRSTVLDDQLALHFLRHHASFGRPGWITCHPE